MLEAERTYAWDAAEDLCQMPQSAIFLTALLLFTGAQAQGDRPNIIVIFTDDQGYADLGVQGQEDDVLTPNIDALAATGVRMRAGYVSAPQCAPSRVGLMSGRYQQRFGFDQNGMTAFPLAEVMLAQRIREAGYVTGMARKWHLGVPIAVDRAWLESHYPEGLLTLKSFRSEDSFLSNPTPHEIKLPYLTTERGFDYAFEGKKDRYWANYTLDGERIEKQYVRNDGYRLDVQTGMALSFIEKNHNTPFFFYLSYFGPHLPLEAPQKYLRRFPETMNKNRRITLGMMAAIDDGVGRIMATLREYNIADKTLVAFLSDNGAPLGRRGNPESWPGSLNTPYIGKKGLLTEGGIRIPFIMSWPGGLPQGVVYERPVISLDIAATALAMAGEDVPPDLDGVNLLPYLRGEQSGDPHESLYWRFFNQTAIRAGDWKYLHFEGREFLFNVESDEHEHINLLAKHPELAKSLRAKLETWACGLQRPGLSILDKPRATAAYKELFPAAAMRVEQPL